MAKHIGISPAGQTLLGTAQLFLLIGSSINGVGDLRLGTVYTYFLARGKPPTDNTTTYLLVGLMMDCAACVVLFVIAPLTIGGSSITHGSNEWMDLGIFLTLPILWSFSGLYSNLHIGLGNSLKAQYPSLVEALARLPALIFVSYDVHSIEGIAIAYVIGASASTIFSIPALLPRLRASRWSEAVGMFRFAWPLMGSLFINYVVTNMTPFHRRLLECRPALDLPGGERLEDPSLRFRRRSPLRCSPISPACTRRRSSRPCGGARGRP